jgi:hypothetical protein
MNQQGLQFLNQSYAMLIPKKTNPQRVSDYRPTSLTHSFAKIISKLVANRLGPELHHLVSINQTTFIKSGCIHDNFVFVQQVVKYLHKKKVSTLFIKLDISKAFDIVNCPYSLNVLTHLCFGQRWRNWISSLWCTSSSCYPLNGESGKRILHCRGVRQGDPLSPMLFFLAMEPLHRLFKKAREVGLLNKISRSCDNFRISIYADDASFLSSQHQIIWRLHIAYTWYLCRSQWTENQYEKNPILPHTMWSHKPWLFSSKQPYSLKFPFQLLGPPLAH